MLLEMHLKLSDLHQEIIDKEIAIIPSSLKNSEGILTVRRNKQILLERTKFKFLRYLAFYENLEDHQKELVNTSIESNHYAFDTKILAKF